jgi:hypothetical protein
MKSTLFVFSLFFVCIINAKAQDIIKLKDSSVIKAKVEKITPTDITYKRTDELTGPDFVIYRQDVESITYANEVKEQMDNGTYIPDRSQRRFHSKNVATGKNIFSLAFIQVTEASTTDNPGDGETYPGFGIHYERMLNKKNTLSFYLPATLSFYSIYNRMTNYDYFDKSTHAFFYAYPGVKYYPRGSNRRCSYSIGASVALGFGRRYYTNEYNTYDSTTYMYSYNYQLQSKSVFKAGLIINNGLNIMASKHVYLGIELGLGFTFYDDDYYHGNNIFITDETKNTRPIIQFNSKVGYRF